MSDDHSDKEGQSPERSGSERQGRDDSKVVIVNHYRSRSKERSRSRSTSVRKPKRKYTRSRSRSRSRQHSHKSKHSRSRRYSRSYSRSASYSPPSYKRGRGRTHSRSPMSNRRRHNGNRENPEPTRCLGVFGLSIYTTERQIHHIFSKYGAVETVQVVVDVKTGHSRGFCFVYYENYEDARVAKEHCTGMEIDGRRIRVDYSITQRAHTPTPGIYMGVKPIYNDRRHSKEYRDYGDRDYHGSGYKSRNRSPSPYYSSSSRSRRRDRSRSRSYSPNY